MPIDITPGVGAYGMFPNYNYTPWGALAELVDNSITSWVLNKEKIRVVDGENAKLVVSIDFDPSGDGKITISDNAAGIAESDLGRAFKLATPPPDLGSISRFGVGMKAAACWFARDWSVRTAPIGESNSILVNWDNAHIVNNEVNSLIPVVSKKPIDSHYTILELNNLLHKPVGRTITKIKSHLVKMYRQYLDSGEVIIRWNDEKLIASRGEILQAPYWREPDSEKVEWKQKIDFITSTGQRVIGVAWLLETMDRQETALNLFWRNRLIKGNFEPHFRPAELFDRPNSWETGRLCIEVDLDEFPPTSDKQAMNFESVGYSEDLFVDELRTHLDEAGRSIVEQARRYRLPKIEREIEDVIAPQVLTAGRELSDVGQKIILNPVPALNDSPYHPISNQSEVATKNSYETSVNINGEIWTIGVAVGPIPGSDLVDIAENSSVTNDGESKVKLVVTLNSSHPFLVEYLSVDNAPALIRFGAALGFGEIAARRAGAKFPSWVRVNASEILKEIAIKESREQ